MLQLLQNCYYYFCHCYRYFHTTLLLNILLQILSLPGVVELTTQLLILDNIFWLPLCRINKFGLNTLPSETVAIPYTCGLSRPFLAPLLRSIALFSESLGIYICWSLWGIWKKTKPRSNPLLRGDIASASLLRQWKRHQDCQQASSTLEDKAHSDPSSLSQRSWHEGRYWYLLS